MKKAISLILALVLCLSLCACGGEKSASSKSTDATTASDSIGANMDLNLDMDLDLDVESITVATGGNMDFDLPDFDYDIEVEAVTVAPRDDLEISLPEFDYNIEIEPIVVERNGISFEFADFNKTIDAESFDVNQFTQESGENFSDEDQKALAGMDDQEIMAIAQTRENLLADLAHAFKTSGLPVEIDEEVGEITLDSSVLFAVDKYEISTDGKEFLKKFITVYTTVVFNPKYEDFVSTVLVEGHTDSDGDYDYNMTLSQNRAESVMSFCLSDESCVDADNMAKLKNSMEAKGYSFDKLIYDENGNEDKAASRRVSFRFLIALP